MDRVRIMKDNISGLKVRNQPLAPALGLVRQEAARVVGELSKLAHVHIEGAHALVFGERGRAPREVVFDGAAKRCGGGEVDETAAVKGDVTCQV